LKKFFRGYCARRARETPDKRSGFKPADFLDKNRLVFAGDSTATGKKKKAIYSKTDAA
jgi:hypothetical protein